MLFCCVVLTCLLSCATSKQKNLVPDQQKTEKELIFLRDTIIREGSTVTIVVHDTVKGKPRTITTIKTKTKVIRAVGQQKIVRDTVFLRSEGPKANKRAVSKPAKKTRSYGIIIIITTLLLSCFVCAAWRLCNKTNYQYVRHKLNQLLVYLKNVLWGQYKKW